MIMNPTTLRRVYDNELLIPSDQDALTLPEVMDTVANSIWSELDGSGTGRYTARKPMVSSLRRNLQREHLERLIDLCFPGAGDVEAYKPVSNLAIHKLRTLREKIAGVVDDKAKAGNVDAYTIAHLSEAKARIDKALDAGYTLNGGTNMTIGTLQLMFGQSTQQGR